MSPEHLLFSRLPAIFVVLYRPKTWRLAFFYPLFADNQEYIIHVGVSSKASQTLNQLTYIAAAADFIKSYRCFTGELSLIDDMKIRAVADYLDTNALYSVSGVAAAAARETGAHLQKELTAALGQHMPVLLPPSGVALMAVFPEYFNFKLFTEALGKANIHIDSPARLKVDGAWRQVMRINFCCLEPDKVGFVTQEFERAFRAGV